MTQTIFSCSLKGNMMIANQPEDNSAREFHTQGCVHKESRFTRAGYLASLLPESSYINTPFFSSHKHPSLSHNIRLVPPLILPPFSHDSESPCLRSPPPWHKDPPPCSPPALPPPHPHTLILRHGLGRCSSVYGRVLRIFFPQNSVSLQQKQ